MRISDWSSDVCSSDLRFVSAAVGTIASVVAFTYRSMAESFALIFLRPSFVTIMSVLFLKEQVGVKRWSAVAIGFAGVLVILRPGCHWQGPRVGKEWVGQCRSRRSPYHSTPIPTTYHSKNTW